MEIILLKIFPLGQYIIRSAYFGYPTEKDTIVLTESNKDLTVNFDLRVYRVPIEYSDSLKEYHNLFRCYYPEEILEIRVDSVSERKDSLYLTFLNRTNFPIYLIEDLDCFNTLSIIIKNKEGNIIPEKIFILRCDQLGMNYLPQRHNSVKINPFGKIKFPVVEADELRINYDELPTGEYFVSVKYEVKDFKYLPGTLSYSAKNNDIFGDELEILSKSLKGIYYSSKDFIISK